MESRNYLRIMRVMERNANRSLAIPESEVSMLGQFIEEKPLNDFLGDKTVRYGCWRMQLKDGTNLDVCGEVTEYDKAVRYLIHIKGDSYDKTKKKSV